MIEGVVILGLVSKNPWILGALMALFGFILLPIISVGNQFAAI